MGRTRPAARSSDQPWLSQRVRHIVPLSWVACDPAAAQVEAAVADPERAAAALRFNKVMVRGLRLTEGSDLPGAAALAGRLTKLTDVKRAQLPYVESVWARVRQVARESGFCVAVMKGAAA